jgi:hypothetical protein
MFASLKREWKLLINAKPGRRFVEHHKRHHDSESGTGSTWKSVVIGVGAFALLICGILLSLTPGIPGFVLWIPPLALLGTRSGKIAAFLDRTETAVRRMIHRR